MRSWLFKSFPLIEIILSGCSRSMVYSSISEFDIRIGSTLLTQLLQCKSVFNVNASIMQSILHYKNRKHLTFLSYIIIEKIYKVFDTILDLIKRISFANFNGLKMRRGQSGDFFELIGKVLDTAVAKLNRYFIKG